MVNTSLDVRFLELIVTLNPCPGACLFNVCDNLLTMEIHVNDPLLKNSDGSDASYR